MFAYSNPTSFRAWDNPDDLASGEVYFDHAPSAAELASAFPTWTAPHAVPATVPMWAMQAALKIAGKYDAINQTVTGWQSATDPNDIAAYFAWTMGNYASRQSVLIATFAAEFGLASADIDALFVAADKIEGSAG